MSIYTLAEAGVAMSSAEIAQYEDDINTYLSLPSTVDFLNDPAQAVHFVHRHYRNVSIADVSVAVLKKAIEDAGWKSVKVEIKNGNEMFISFYVEEQTETPPPNPTPVDSVVRGVDPDTEGNGE